MVTAPSNPAEVGAAKPLAWIAYWPGSGSINSQTLVTRFASVMTSWAEEGAEITPLYASPPIGDTGGAFRQGIEAAAAVAKYGMDRAQRDYRTESPGSHAYRMAEEIHDAILALVPARVEAVDHIADAGKMVEPRVSDTGWLIECKPSVSRTPQWFHLEEEWVTDASKALRFARKQDAEAFIEHTGWTETFASEHMWSDPK